MVVTTQMALEKISQKSAGVLINSQIEKYLTFRLGEQEFGISILKVKEIISIIGITPLPHTPQHVKGIINLRGKIIPVIDLRLKLGFDEVAYTERTCIIVVNVKHGTLLAEMSIIVDFVSEVLNVSHDNIDPSPRFDQSVSTEYILGIAKINDTVKILLDINKILDGEDVDAIVGNIG